jgi:hypothetical protein
MKRLVPVVVMLMVTGCAPSYQDVRNYGEEKFIREMLAVADGIPAPQALKEAFRPIRAEPHLNGAWLLMIESSRYQQGIYVDRKSLDGWGGSGMEVTAWSTQLGWSKEKIRGRARTNASTLSGTRGTPAAYAPAAPGIPER